MKLPKELYLKKIFFLSLVSILLCSCEERQSEIIFNSSFPKKNNDLSELWGDKFTLISKGDTFAVSISYSANGNNLVKNEKKGDTIFFGTVSKYRGTLYFSEKISGEFYNIFVAKKRGNLIYGLNMREYQKDFVCGKIWSGDFENMVVSRNTDTTVICLRPEKKLMKELFNGLLNPTFSPDSILAGGERKPLEIIDLTSEQENKTEESAVFSKIYPNPFNDFLKVELIEGADCHYSLSDMSGKKLMSGTFSSSENIVTKQLPPGFYLLSIIVPEKQSTEFFKLMKSE
ncbi:MAG: T9SS type A sorting domain-containing protein [Bacteroidia bacterium]|nr:T9SS type A sorting domain-containing protein [Bacteroidia bacterium]